MFNPLCVNKLAPKSLKKRLLFIKIMLLVFVLTGSMILIIAYPYRYRILNRMSALWYNNAGGIGGPGNCRNCAFLFTDNVKKHQKAYLRDGISVQKEDSDLEKLFYRGKLRKLQSNNLYEVDGLTHSQPFILPKGQRFISKLAGCYYERCVKDSLDYIPFKITSVTRSRISVEKLMRSNKNAIENSAHLKGKTFDISYRAFNGNRKQSAVFMEVLQELRKDGECFVKYERNGCLHVTVI